MNNAVKSTIANGHADKRYENTREHSNASRKLNQRGQPGQQVRFRDPQRMKHDTKAFWPSTELRVAMSQKAKAHDEPYWQRRPVGGGI